VAPSTVDKYGGLARYLKFRGAFTGVVKLSFVRIDGVIRDNLPMAAYKSEAWWSNASGNVHAKGWLDVGWEVQEVNLKEGYVVFHKVREIQPQTSAKRARANQITKPFTPVRVRIPRKKEPSKTKVSKLYARIKNLERQRAALPSYRGSFKPKPRHEKRLFREREKTQ
jgi:hypothetical protein